MEKLKCGNDSACAVQLLGSILQSGKNIVLGQLREIVKNFFLAHSGSKIPKNVAHSDTKISDTGLAGAFSFGN